ncbi:Serine/threonine protein phosphatase, partial [Dysosmobacter welbionis]
RQNGAGEAQEIILQNGEGGHVQVVGGLVQQQHVGGFHQHGQQIQPPPLPAGEPPDGHRLKITGEEEPLHHLVGGEGALIGPDLIGDVVDKVVDPLVQVQLSSLLGEVADLHGGAHLHRAAVRCQFACHQVEQGGLPGAVAAHDADAVTAQQVVGEAADDGTAVKGLGHIPQLDDLLPQAAGGRRHLHGLVRFRCLLVQQGLVPLDPLFGLGGPGLAAPHDPLPLHPEDRLALALT